MACNGFSIYTIYRIVHERTTGIKSATFFISNFLMYIEYCLHGLHHFNNVLVQFARGSKTACKDFPNAQFLSS